MAIFHLRKGAISGSDWSGLLQGEVLSGPIGSFCKLRVIEPRQSSEILMADIKNQCLRLAIKTRTVFSNTTKHYQALDEILFLDGGWEGEGSLNFEQFL